MRLPDVRMLAGFPCRKPKLYVNPRRTVAITFAHHTTSRVSRKNCIALCWHRRASAMRSSPPKRRANDLYELRPNIFDRRGLSSNADAHQTRNTSAQKFARRMRRSPLSSQEAGVLRCRCDYCGGHLCLIVFRYYRMRFCYKAHMKAYQQRLTTETRAKIRDLKLLARSSS